MMVHPIESDHNDHHGQSWQENEGQHGDGRVGHWSISTGWIVRGLAFRIIGAAIAKLADIARPVRIG
jgi:hypothetical protein